MSSFSYVRNVLEVDCVSRAWIEWNLRAQDDELHTRTLVVEIKDDEIDEYAVEAIERNVLETQAQTTMIISHVRVVPKGR